MKDLDFISGTPSYFETQAFLGTTKHMGGLEATKELLELCHIDPTSRVLDVGCGVGATACYLVKRYGCRVWAADRLESMAALARQRVHKYGLELSASVQVADVRALPMDDDQFDILICESVLTFVNEKLKALKEVARVIHSGGLIAFNEEVWLKVPPPQEMMEYAARTWGITGEILTKEMWFELLNQAGISNIQALDYRVDVRRESSQISRYSAADLWIMFRKISGLYIRSPEFRRFLHDSRRRPPHGLFNYLGYCLFVGTVES